MKKLSNILKSLQTKDIIIALILMVLPFLFYTYTLAPTSQIWETHWFIINSGRWEDVSFYLWALNVKLLIIISLVIWYSTCNYWWRYTILVPLIIELFKLYSFILIRL